MMKSFQNPMWSLSIKTPFTSDLLISNPSLNLQSEILLSFSPECRFPLIWSLPLRRYCSTVYLRLVREEMKVKGSHKSNRSHWLSLTSWKCNICHDLPKWLPCPCSCRTVKGPFVLCKAACAAERCTLVLCASLPIHPLMVHHRVR